MLELIESLSTYLHISSVVYMYLIKYLVNRKGGHNMIALYQNYCTVMLSSTILKILYCNIM